MSSKRMITVEWLALSKGVATDHHLLTVAVRESGTAGPDVMFTEKLEMQTVETINRLIF